MQTWIWNSAVEFETAYKQLPGGQLVFCQAFCAEVIGATATEGFLVLWLKLFLWLIVNHYLPPTCIWSHLGERFWVSSDAICTKFKPKCSLKQPELALYYTVLLLFLGAGIQPTLEPYAEAFL